MIITPLWHTEFLVDIQNPDGNPVRILVDAWFSDFAIGDLMERAPRVRLDPEKIGSIDAIFISHAHCDHFDPYTLLQIYGVSREIQPLLILPFTLRYLEGLLQEYLPHVDIHWLGNNEKLTIQWVEIQGMMFDQDEITNEDDVMMLAIMNEKEIVFAEIDTLPPDSYEVQKALYRLFTRRDYETICYLASRNELEGNLKILDLPDAKSREHFAREYVHERREAIEWGYAKWEYEDYENIPNFFGLPGFVRGFIGQGICYPQSISASLSTLAALPLAEVVDIEVGFAEKYGYHFPQKCLTPGRQYRIHSGTIETGRKECPIGELMKSQHDEAAIRMTDVHLYAS